MNAFCTCSGMSASGTQTRRWFSSNTSAKRSPLRSSTTLAPGSLQALELGVIGQIGERLVVEIDHVAEIDRRHWRPARSCRTAGRRVEIGEIDAAEGLALARDRLRVVHGGGDEFVEIDVLDVEGLAHMGAARAEQLRHRGWSRVRSKRVSTASGAVVT